MRTPRWSSVRPHVSTGPNARKGPRKNNYPVSTVAPKMGSYSCADPNLRRFSDFSLVTVVLAFRAEDQPQALRWTMTTRRASRCSRGFTDNAG